MRVQSSVPGYGRTLQGSTVPEDLLETIIRAVTEAVVGQPGRLREEPRPLEDDRPDLPALLAPQQVADLLGISRNTVDRMVEDGELPGIVLREGNRQRMVRVPKGFVLQLIRDLNKGAQISLREYADKWRATVASQTAAAGVLGVAEVA
jgi:excisionase family DNA binding protein